MTEVYCIFHYIKIFILLQLILAIHHERKQFSEKL